MIFGLHQFDKGLQRWVRHVVASSPEDLIRLAGNIDPAAQAPLRTLLCMNTIVSLPGTTTLHDCEHCKLVLVVGAAVTTAADDLSFLGPVTRDAIDNMPLCVPAMFKLLLN